MRVSTERFEIYRGDCLEVMPTLDAGSFDAVIADIPYGTTACGWDSVIPFGPMWEQLTRLAKPDAAIILFASQPFTSALVMSNLKLFRDSLVWEKSNPSGFLNARRMPLRAHEDLAVFYQKLPKYRPQGLEMRPVHGANKFNSGVYGRDPKPVKEKVRPGNYPRSVLRFRSVTRPIHSTQKPVDLLAYLVKTYTDEGDRVLDFTMGVGSTGVAAIQEGRRFVGVELDPKYFALAHERLAEASVPKFEQASILLPSES